MGSYLVSLGYRVEYDKKINGQTPDWWVQNSDGIDLFFLDVRSQEVRMSSKEGFHKTSSSKNSLMKQ